MSNALIDRIDQAIDHLSAAERDDRPIVAYARRSEALRLLGAVVRDLATVLDTASEAVENHLLSEGVRKLSLADPAVTLFVEHRPFCGIVYAEGEDTDAGHERAASALAAAGLADFAHMRVNLQGLTSHYRELLNEEGEEAVNARLAEELGGAVKLTVTSKVKTRKAS